MKLGKLPPNLSAPRLMLAPHLTTAPETPRVADYLSLVPSWPMYGNDRYGDCVFAMVGHFTQAATRYGEGAEERMTTTQVLNAYSAVTGFDPADPDTDRGTVMQDAMTYWRKTGVGGHKIRAFASVNPTNHAELRAAVQIFGAALIGFNFPSFAWDQFDQGRPWDVSTSSLDIEGGHAVHVGAYDADDRMVTLTTWGTTQQMTYDFWDRYVDEVWVVITDEWLNALNGKSPTGLDLYGLGEDFAALTGDANPFPAPVPTPPAPTMDDVLAVAAVEWLKVRHRTANNVAFEKAVKLWLAERL